MGVTRSPSPPALRLALVGLVLLAALGLAVPWLAQRGQSEMSVEIARRLESAPATLVLGSSVAQMGIDVEHLPGSASLAFPGTQPAHWLAIWRHHVLPSGHRPARLVLYAPLSSLGNGELVEEAERSAFVSLLPWSDRELEELALGAPIGAADRFHRYRRALRDGLLSTITEAPTAFGVDLPEQAPTAPNAAAQGQVQMPRTVPVHQGLVARLIDEASAAGTRVTVVVPVVTGAAAFGDRRDSGEQDLVVGWLLDEPVDLIDLSCLPVPAGEFLTHHHLRERGREQVTEALAQRIAALGPAAAETAGTYTRCRP